MNFNIPGQDDGTEHRDGIPRRRFLGAAGAAGTAAAAAAVLGSGRAGASTRPDRPHGTRQSSAGRARPDSIGAAGAGLVGATVIPTGSTSRIQAATNFNNNLNPAGSPLSRPLATTVQKVYFTPGTFPIAPLPTYITDLHSAGCKLILCYKPATDGTDETNLKNSLQAMNNAGITGSNAEVVLWQEVQNSKNGVSAAQFGSVMSDYAPIVNSHGFPLVYDASYDQSNNGIQDYFDSASAALTTLGLSFAEIAVDLYASMYWGSNNYNLTTPMAIADGTNPPTPIWGTRVRRDRHRRGYSRLCPDPELLPVHSADDDHAADRR